MVDDIKLFLNYCLTKNILLVGPLNPGFNPLGNMNPGRPFPGARFDPPNPLGRLNPDNDELQPPPGYDDMFM